MRVARGPVGAFEVGGPESPAIHKVDDPARSAHAAGH